ncbi:MAG: alkaline phosphatase PhoX [Pseudomonadota bacterium]
MTLSRRTFLRYGQAAGLFYSAAALGGLSAVAASAQRPTRLTADPAGLLDLPEGFAYSVVSRTGDTMADGFFRPGRPDGMACFADPANADRCILMRNHENWPDTMHGSPFGANNELLDRVPDGRLFGLKPDGSPFFGGVTKVVYDMRTGQLVEDYLVLTGTAANCAGGRTPWGSWLTCEESMRKPPEESQRYHGFVFETPSSATGLIEPVPLTAMGRFVHEAVAVDPDTGIVYLTEDSRTGLFYRFLPDTPGELHRGGRLQALAIREWPSAVTSNWPRDWGGAGIGTIEQGRSFAVDWIDLDNVESPDADLPDRGYAAGAARFYRGEGMDYGRRPDGSSGDVFFTCTQGGVQRAGQVWQYSPSSAEGQSGETADPGTLTLVYESPGADALDMCDNIAVAPWGDLILCEDGQNENYLRGLTPAGQIYDFARNAHADKSEFCGACFSPDGRIMFVNIQEPGITLAVTGPWDTLRA